jgi:peptidoglycan/LPS O-acetylase OafA/YrhL
MGLIRLYLALIVAADHLLINVLSERNLNINGYTKLGLNGGTAVMFFYMISGFLISYALEKKYTFMTGDTREFYAARFIRIFSIYWPLYFFLIAADIWDIRRVVFQGSLADILTGFFLLGADWRIAFASYPQAHWDMFATNLQPCWTLAAELTFYLLAPWLLKSTKIIIAVFLASLTFRLYMVYNYGYRPIWSYYFFPGTICFFLAGHLARLACNRFRVPSLASLGFLAISVYALLPQVYLRIPFDNLHLYVASGFFAMALPGLFHLTKDWKPLNWLGELSYPLYLTHMTIMYLVFISPSASGTIGTWIFKLAGNATDSVTQAFIITGIFLLICIAVSATLFYVVERPVARFMHALLSTRKRHVPIDVPPPEPITATAP